MYRIEQCMQLDLFEWTLTLRNWQVCPIRFCFWCCIRCTDGKTMDFSDVKMFLSLLTTTWNESWIYGLFRELGQGLSIFKFFCSSYVRVQMWLLRWREWEGILMTNTVSATADSHSVRLWKSIELLRSLSFSVLSHWPAFRKMWFQCTVSDVKSFHTYCTGVSIHTVVGLPDILYWGFRTYCSGVLYILYWGFHTYCTGVTIHTMLGFHRYCARVTMHTVLGFRYILYWGFHTYALGFSYILY